MKTTILSMGEMGGAIAELLIAKGCPVATCLDGRSDSTRKRAMESGVECASSLASSIAGSEFVFSLVPPDAAVDMAHKIARAAPGLSKPPIYVDANSISPMTMERVENIITGAGMTCVDGTFIGNAGMLKTKTVFYASGYAADAVSSAYGSIFRIKVLGPSIGVASAFKLSMYGFNKGAIAIFLEIMSAANRMGLRDEMHECLEYFYPGTMETIERLLPTYPKHVRRRAVEMGEVVEWLKSMSQFGPMAEGTKNIMERLSNVGIDIEDGTDYKNILDSCMQSDFMRIPAPKS